MAVNIKFDLTGNPEPPTIILATRSGDKLGQLEVDENSIELSDKFNDASELSFTLNKYVDGKLTNLWDKVVNFKLIWCKEWDMWFEATVELDEETETIKTVFCKQLGQAELSQIMLYNIEINTEDDIARDDYKITILYNENDAEASLLHRLLKDKAPHYSINYVDETIKNIQRTFSFDGTSIYDAFMEIAEEVGCLFVFHSNSDENGKIQRTISVYDLQQNCLNPDCKHRGEFTDKCPKCEGKNDNGEEFGIKYGYGNDTLIFVTSDELATNGIQMTTDTDAVKNCFKLEAGDDLMTATIRNCNPNGTDYIWYFSNENKEDMSKELVDRIGNYDKLYNEYYNDREFKLDESLLSRYNSLVTNYRIYYNKTVCLDCNNSGDFEEKCPKCGSTNILIKNRLNPISTTIKGYSNLITAYYDTIDLALYLESSLMPTIEMSNTSAEEQAKLLTTSSLSPVAVTNVDTVSLATANSAVLAMAKIIVKSTYKVEIESSELIKNNNGTATWKGIFVITNYSDEEDTDTTEIISVTVNDDEESYIKQKIDKALNKEDTDDYSISGLFEKEYDDFCNELKKYALNPLVSFRDAAQSCIDILIEQGVGDDESIDLYKNLYNPYYKKLMAIESEIKIREDEISIIKGVYNLDNELITEGLQYYIEKYKNEVQEVLNFEKYLGTELWLEFCAYRRDDKYSNDNYISDGLSNSELFKRALEFVDVANKELYKSAELQHSISTSLNNLLAIKKFKPLVDSFELGNWIRVQVDDKIYKLRLLEYGINFGSFDSINVEFSDVTKIKNGITDIQSVLSQASSMATSYDSVKKQASQGNEAKGTINDFLTNGLNTALVQIQNNNSEEVTLTKNGLLARSYNEISDTYSPEQLKITHNILAYTDNNWQTIRLALGKHSYSVYDKNKVNDDGSVGGFVNEIGYGLSADFVVAGIVSGSQIIGGDIYSDNYSEINATGSYINLRDGTFSFGGGSLRFEDNKLLISSPDIPTTETITEINEEYLKTTSVYAQNLQVGSANIQGQLTAKQINTTGLIAENISGTTISGKIISGGSISIGNNFSVDTSGNLISKNADIKGIIKADRGYIGNLTLENGSLYSGTTSMSSTSAGIYLGKDGFRQYNNAKAYVSIQNGVINAAGAKIAGNIDATEIRADKKYSIWNSSFKSQVPVIWTGTEWTDYVTSIHMGISGNNGNIIYPQISYYLDVANYGNGINTSTVGINADEIFLNGSYTSVMMKQAGINIETEGSMGINFGSWYEKGTGDYALQINSDSDGSYIQSLPTLTRTSDSAANVRIGTTGDNKGIFYKSSSSSKRYKHDIKDLNIEEVYGLYDAPVRTFKYNLDYLSSDSERYNIDIPGFIAEEIDKILPIAVDHFEDGSAEMWNSNILVPCLLKLIQNNKKEKDELEQRVNKLELFINQLINN